MAGASRLELAQLPDSIAIPPQGGEEEEEDTTTVVPPTPAVKPAPSPATAPFDTTGAHVPAPGILQPGGAPPDTLRPGGPLPSMPPLPRTPARADTAAAVPERHGLRAISPAAIVIGLIAVHVLVVKLLTK